MLVQKVLTTTAGGAAVVVEAPGSAAMTDSKEGGGLEGLRAAMGVRVGVVSMLNKNILHKTCLPSCLNHLLRQEKALTKDSAECQWY